MNEGLPVKGYVSQSDNNVALVNENKVLEEKVLRQLDKLYGVAGIDLRWLAIAKTQIEQGFMAANRSVFKPKRLEGDLD